MLASVPELPSVNSSSKSEELTTLADWLSAAKEQIDSLDAELIAVNTFVARHTDRSWIVAHPQYKLSEDCQRYGDKLVKQRAEGVPLAYLLRYKEFYGRDFRVQPGVLIPRPETEILIEMVKNLKLPQRPRVLEIGTGCGCIAITLALEIPQAEVMATDISTDALVVAEQNNLSHEGRVELLKSDLLAEIQPEIDGQFDVVVANLPYVNPDWKWVQRETLKYEPMEAIYALDNNGLSVYQRFFAELAEKADALGVRYLVVEVDPCQHKELTKLARGYGWRTRRKLGYGLTFSRKCAIIE